MASDKETSPSRSRQMDDRKKHRKLSSRDQSPRHKGKRRSSSSSHRSPLSSRSASPSEKHRMKKNEKTSRGRDDRSRSRTPTAYRKDGGDSRDDPNVCHCLGVFGLSSYTQEKDLREVFGKYGPIDDICIIYDRQSGHSKGYGFVYFKSTSDAVEARRETQGLVLDRRPIRVDYSFTTRPHSPTPGRYMGRRDLDKYYSHDNGDYEDRPSYRDSGRRGSYRDRQHYCDYDRDEYRDEYEESYSSRRSSRRYSPYSRK
ncbi:transformer-2 protein homolog beta-like isoform X2 [Physella acuta]|uniref:transformer-2 protein homolog beta-like isoform X2 n=1 Tax=Physella acuta TaxID=109671 RepID=UPI0027DDD9F7|nr:transformer-2 protein homolog beta-like isoform X2 [Physella acuta]XP_059165099.1 transformer-2 protein homolog beta-like isoform X2 [Physella acuta]